MEAMPSAPIFEDAPLRLRYFLVEAFQTYIPSYQAVRLVGRVLCKPELINNHPRAPIDDWIMLSPFIFKCQWWEIYNLIEAIWESMDSSKRPLFTKSLNELFSAETIGWKMDGDGHLERVLPGAVHVQVEQVFRELESPRFSPALVLVTKAYEAYNRHPRVDLDVCTNIFDAFESAGKEVFALPSGTFGDVLKKARGIFAPETISILEKVYALASNHFRHGMTEPFKLTPAETDFVYVACLGGMMLFVRSKPAN